MLMINDITIYEIFSKIKSETISIGPHARMRRMSQHLSVVVGLITRALCALS